MDKDFIEIIEKTAGKYGLEVSQELDFKPPVRLGSVLDTIQRAGARAARKPLIYGDYALDLDQGLFIHGDQRISLTEKEGALLKILISAQGDVVQRQTLLDQVWGYADSVETHTLETHIYRLRQKIEKDAAQPDIVLTEENGYRVSS